MVTTPRQVDRIDFDARGASLSGSMDWFRLTLRRVRLAARIHNSQFIMTVLWLVGSRLGLWGNWHPRQSKWMKKIFSESSQFLYHEV